MRVVLYAHDMEPITVLELPLSAWSYLVKQGCVRVPVFSSPQYSCIPIDVPDMETYRTVTITAELFYRKGIENLMLFTSDEENAMLLRCAFLPGQQKTLQEREAKAMAKGFAKALRCLGSE